MIRTFLVDDEAAALGRYAAYVEAYGEPFLVAAACSSAREAFEEASRRAPDLVITDIRMPGEDGLALLQRLRDSGWDGAAVVISGHDDFTYAQRAIRIGILDFLLKPVFPEDMRGLLDRLVGRIAEGSLGAALPPRTMPLPPVFKSIENAASREMPAAVRKALRFVDSRWDSHFSVEDAARAACVSPAWLSASFKRAMGMSVMEYARLRRVEKACEILSGTEAPLKEIADRLAFPDLPTFAKLFRKVVGMSPGAWRKSIGLSGDGRNQL